MHFLKQFFVLFCLLIFAACSKSGSDSSDLIEDTVASPSTLALTISITNSNYKLADVLEFSVEYTEPITVSGTPRLNFDLNSQSRFAEYVSGSGTSALLFQYTVTASDIDLDGIEILSPLDLNGGSLTSTTDTPELSFTPPDTTLVRIDGEAPEVTNITPPANQLYIQNQNLDFVLTFSEAVTIFGTPRLALTVGAQTLYANYLSGSSTQVLTFRYTPISSQVDLDGIAALAPIDLNGGTIRDSFQNPAGLTFTPPDLTGVTVNGDADTTLTLNAPTNILSQNAASYTLSGTCSDDTQPVSVVVGSLTVTPAPVCTTNLWSTTFDATSISDGAAITMTVNHEDGAGNFAPEIQKTVLKDTDVPDISSIAINPQTYQLSQVLSVFVTFDQAVIVTGSPRLEILMNSQSATTLYAQYVSGSSTNNLRFDYTIASGDNDLDGINVSSPLDLNGGSITDTNLNPATLTHATTNFPTVLVDSAAPYITSFVEPANGVYAQGGTLFFQVNFSEPITVTGTPRLSLNVGGITRFATYQTGSGSSGLEFSYTVDVADNDLDGLTLNSTSIELNGGTIQSTADGDHSALGFASYLDSMTGVTINNSSGITPPNQVTGVITAPTTINTVLSDTWSIPNNNGTPIIDFSVQYREQGTSTWINVSPNPISNTVNINSLSSGVTYEIRVAANNGLLGPYSAISTAEVWDITSLDLAMWLDATDPSQLFTNTACTTQVASNGNQVACWKDKSGFGRDFIQNTAASRPLYRTSAINGLPGLEFDGSNDFLVDEDGENYINGFQAFEFFVVVQSDVMSTDRGILDTEDPDGNDDGITLRFDAAGASGGCTQCIKGGIQVAGGAHVQAESANNTQSTAKMSLGATWTEGGKFKIYKNGTYTNSWDNGALTGLTDLATKVIIGKGPKDASSSWDGKIVEVIFLNTQLSDADRARLNNYLNSKYGL